MVEFNIGDSAVYPGHGVGKITSIDTKEVAGKEHTFYAIQIQDSGMKIMVPKEKTQSVGLRPVITKTQAGKVISMLKDNSKTKIDNQTWNRRYREYMEKIKTGSIYEVAEVLRDLCALNNTKDLSFGEKKMLVTARGLLLSELYLAINPKELEDQEDFSAIFGLDA